MALVAVTDHPVPHLEAARAVLEPAGHEPVDAMLAGERPTYLVNPPALQA